MVAGKLGALLAQFPASFHATSANRIHLATVLRAFSDHTIAVELRHRTWSDAAPETWPLLDAFGATWTWIDEPRFKDSVVSPEFRAGQFVYARLHGRNAKVWWRGSNDERCAYDYSNDELKPIAERKGAPRVRLLEQSRERPLVVNA